MIAESLAGGRFAGRALPLELQVSLGRVGDGTRRNNCKRRAVRRASSNCLAQAANLGSSSGCPAPVLCGFDHCDGCSSLIPLAPRGIRARHAPAPVLSARFRAEIRRSPRRHGLCNSVAPESATAFGSICNRSVYASRRTNVDKLGRRSVRLSLHGDAPPLWDRRPLALKGTNSRRTAADPPTWRRTRDRRVGP
jgi:hypothetical protein